MTNTEAPTAAKSLERSDRALLRRLAFEAQAVAATRKNLADNHDAGTIALSAQRVAEAAAKFEVVLEVVRATGAGTRNQALFVAALDGNDDDLY